MSDIYVRRIDERSKTALAVLAASIDVSLNSLCVSILEEAALPYDEIVDTIVERAREIESSKNKRLEVKNVR